MRKKFFAGTAVAMCVLGFSLCTVSIDATSNDIVTNDQFVFDANNLTSNYESGAYIAQDLNVSVKLGNNYQGNILNAGFDFGDYNFNYCLLANTPTYSAWESLYNNFFKKQSKNQDLAQYYISASEGTRCGVYYTVVDKTPVDNTYYVSNNNTVSVIKEKGKNKYTTVDTFTEQLDSMYYSEFTFGTQGTVGLKSDTQYICLFGVTVVTETEIENREESNQAIENLIDYYNTYGVSTSEEFTNLVDAAKESLEGVNHVSKIADYDTYQDILAKYDELANVEAKISELRLFSAFARTTMPLLNVSYDDATKELLDDIANEIAAANALGISNEEISNYNLYLEALNMYNEMSNAAIEAFVNKVAEANAVKGETSSYALINEAEELYNALNSYDKENESVVAAYNALQEVKAAYTEYQESVTENTISYTYNEDGTIEAFFFVGTINDFVCSSDIESITMYITNEATGEVQESNISSVYKALKLNGEYVKTKIEGVRYIYTKVANTDGQYNDITLSMSFTIKYKDGHVVTSKSFSTLEA